MQNRNKKKEADERVRKITSILSAVSFATEKERQREIDRYVNNNWPVEQIFKIHENSIHPQKYEQVKREVEKKE